MELLSRASAVLAIVDVQERLMTAMPPDGREAVDKNAAILIQTARTLGVPVLSSEQYPKGLGPTIPSLVAALGPEASAIEKLVFSCARSPEFMTALCGTGRRDVILSGVETHVCVLQTTVDLINAGYQVYVPADAVTSRRTLDWERGLALMAQAGAIVGTTEAFVFQLLERAGTDEFKAISKR